MIQIPQTQALITLPLTAVLLLMAGCETGLDVVNVDRTRLTSVDPVMQLNFAVINSAATLGNLQCETSIVKQHMRIFTGSTCGNVNVDARQFSDGNWTNGYGTRLRNLKDVIDGTRDNPARQNLHNMARIYAAYTMMRITDSYGDVPYTDAARGHVAGSPFPGYDSQEFIYTSPEGILEELKNATAALRPAAASPSGDLLYGGDIERWRRLGNSLLLRAAFRLTKVDFDLARQYVQAAVSGPGGLMSSNGDNAVVRHNSEFRNPAGNALNGGQAHFNYLVHDFVDHLKQMNDPRLGAIAVRYPNATGAAGQTPANANRNPADQIGIPMGYDNTTIPPVAAAQGLVSFFAYSQPDRQRIMDPQAPSFLVTYAQTELLLAEAAHRNWIPGDPATHFANGIRAHMEQISTSYNNTTIPVSAINAYIAAHPLQAGRELEQINTQYWIASFLIPDESWANFRRSCYPRLAPNPRQDDLGPTERFMRRFGYPDEERTVNPNVARGTSPDRIDTRVWWDVRISELC